MSFLRQCRSRQLLLTCHQPSFCSTLHILGNSALHVTAMIYANNSLLPRIDVTFHHEKVSVECLSPAAKVSLPYQHLVLSFRGWPRPRQSQSSARTLPEYFPNEYSSGCMSGLPYLKQTQPAQASTFGHPMSLLLCSPFNGRLFSPNRSSASGSATGPTAEIVPAEIVLCSPET